MADASSEMGEGGKEWTGTLLLFLHLASWGDERFTRRVH